MTIPRSMFDRELDYYGIMSAEGITGRKSLPQFMAEAKRKLCVAKKDHDLVFLAHESHCKFYQNMLDDDKMQKDPTTDSVSIRIDRGHMFYESFSKVHAGGNDRVLFDTYLEKYFGLMLMDGKKRIKKYDDGQFVFGVQMKK